MKYKHDTKHYLIDITKMGHDGRGIGQLEGKTLFVEGALAGEQVNCQIIKKHGRFLEAKALDIIQSSLDRVKPSCHHFGLCGGCSMQHIASGKQITLKEATLLEHLQHFGQVIPKEILSPISASLWGYRRKARLGVRFVHKKNKLLVGFREKWSNYLTDVQHCPVLHPTVGNLLSELAELISQLCQAQQIPQIEIAVGDQATALVFRHLTPLPESDMTALKKFAEKYHFHFYLQPNSPDSIRKIWPNDTNTLLSYQLPDYDVTMQFHPLDFTQVNSEVNLLMIRQALALLDLQPNDDVLDLFCGLGNFTLPIARFAKQVTGIEGCQTMVERAIYNAKLNAIQNAIFAEANLMCPPTNAEWLNKNYDKILLDPPRSGAKEMLPYLTKLSPKKIVYVSCNPATLARDAGELVHQYEFKLSKVGAINMFPHTSHIEAIALFERDH